jgi:hypothetical protein
VIRDGSNRAPLARGWTTLSDTPHFVAPTAPKCTGEGGKPKTPAEGAPGTWSAPQIRTLAVEDR